MEPEPTSRSTTDADGGLPSWPRFRLFYSLWSSAADWQQRGRLVRFTVIQASHRLRNKVNGR